MIGAFVAAYFIGKRDVMHSLIFWFVLLIAGWILAAYAFGEGGIGGLLANFFIGLLLFIGLAIIYLKVDLKTSAIMYVVALIINVVIGFISGISFGLASGIMELIQYV